MAAGPDGEPRAVRRPRGARELFRRSLVTGVAITIPLLVTLVVLGFVLNFLSSTLNPVVGVVDSFGFFQEVTSNADLRRLLIEVLTVVTLLAFVLTVGFLAEFGPGDGTVGRQFDAVMESIPGLGSVYTSFNEMSDLLLDSDTDSFEEVKLVEYPRDGSYTVAFKTAETAAVVEDATGHEEMETLFMPMAPNPVMGGFVIHVSTDRVVDVDMTVEEGIRSIVTSGVATGGGGERAGGLTASEMRELGGAGHVDRQFGSAASPDVRRAGTEPTDRREQYEAAVSPEHSETAHGIEERADEGGTVGRRMGRDRPETVTGEEGIGESAEERPAERVGDDPDEGLTGGKTPAEMAGRDESDREPTDRRPAAVPGDDATPQAGEGDGERGDGSDADDPDDPDDPDDGDGASR